MRKISIAMMTLAATMMFSCGGSEEKKAEGTTENEPKEDPYLPEKEMVADRDFTIYTIGEEAVNAKDLSAKIQSFRDDVLGKQIAIIVAPNPGYLQKGIGKQLNEQGVKGEYGPFTLRRSHDDPTSNLEQEQKDKYLVFNGTLSYDMMKGERFMLNEAVFASAISQDEKVEIENVSWSDLGTENPVFPGNIMALVTPLKDVEITVTDKIKKDKNGNYVMFKGDDTSEGPEGKIVTCNFQDRKIMEKLKDGGVYSIKGKIGEFNLDEGTVWLGECVVVE